MRNAVVLFLSVIAIMALSADCAADSDKTVVIVINERFEVFDQCIEGFRMECERKTETINVKSLKAESAVKKVGLFYPDAVLAMDDQALKKISGLKATPIVYVLARKSKDMTQPNITGVEADVNPDSQLSVIRAVAPEIGKIGYMHSDQCFRIAADLKKLAPKHGIEIVSQKVETRNEACQYIDRAPDIDAFIMLPDFGIYNEYRTIRRMFRRIAVRKKTPVISFSDNFMRTGATFSICPDVCYAGRQAGKMVERILSGEDVAKIPPEYTAKWTVIVNPAVARKNGLELTLCNLKAYRDFNRGKPKWVGSDAYCREKEGNGSGP